jgi:hypothetical protein
MALTTPLPSPRWFRHPALVYEQHPQLGDYIYSPTIKSWTHRRAVGDGQVLLIVRSRAKPFRRPDEALEGDRNTATGIDQGGRGSRP